MAEFINVTGKQVDIRNCKRASVFEDPETKEKFLYPCKLSFSEEHRETTKSGVRVNWEIEITMDPDIIAFDDDYIVEDVFVPLRKEVGQAIFFSLNRTKKNGVYENVRFRLTTLNVWRDDSESHKSKAARVKDLTTEKKRELVCYAVNKLLRFIMTNASDERVEYLRTLVE